MLIGNKIKRLRKGRGMTLQDASRKTGLSVGFLSNLERDMTSPTIDQLEIIAQLYNITMPELVAEPQSFQPVVRKEERAQAGLDSSSIRYELTTSRGLPMRGLCITFAPEFFGDEQSWGHLNDWYGIIIEGVLQMEMNGNKYTLNEGDAVYIPAQTPHRYHKLNEGPCVSYWTELQGTLVGGPSPQGK